MSRLRGAHRATERQGRRLRVLQTLPSRRDCAGMDPGTGSRSDARMASALRRCAVLLRLVAHARTPARRRSAQTTTGRRMARAVHCHRSVRELGGGRRRRLRRRLNAWASIAVCEQDRSSASAYSTAPAASSRSPASVVAADLKEREYLIRSPTPVTAPDVAIGAAMKQPRETASTHGPVTPEATVSRSVRWWLLLAETACEWPSVSADPQIRLDQPEAQPRADCHSARRLRCRVVDPSEVGS